MWGLFFETIATRAYCFVPWMFQQWRHWLFGYGVICSWYHEEIDQTTTRNALFGSWNCQMDGPIRYGFEILPFQTCYPSRFKVRTSLCRCPWTIKTWWFWICQIRRCENRWKGRTDWNSNSHGTRAVARCRRIQPCLQSPHWHLGVRSLLLRNC